MIIDTEGIKNMSSSELEVVKELITDELDIRHMMMEMWHRSSAIP